MSASRLFVVSAPSGAGKSTLIRALMERVPGLSFSISHTTRKPRPGEMDGVHYHFVAYEDFARMEREGRFLEWAEVHGNFYGTSFESVECLHAKGCDVVLDIDVQGAEAVRKKRPDSILIFILPPSVEELERRLTKRGETPDVMHRRLLNARREVEQADWFDYLIVNDDFNRAADELVAVVTAERLRASQRSGLLETFCKSTI